MTDEELTPEEEESVQKMQAFFNRKRGPIETELNKHYTVGSVGGFLAQCACGEAVDDGDQHLAEVLEPLIRKREAVAWKLGDDAHFEAFMGRLPKGYTNPYEEEK